jgi:hypothetical protein
MEGAGLGSIVVKNTAIGPHMIPKTLPLRIDPPFPPHPALM